MKLCHHVIFGTVTQTGGDKERRDTVYEILLVGEWLLRTSVDRRVNDLHAKRCSPLR